MKRRKRNYARKQTPAPSFELTSGVNPFEIEEGHVYAGTRANTGYATLLVEQMNLLPVDKNKSIMIPLSICKTKTEANNLFTTAKRRVYAKNKNVYYSLRNIYSVDKKSYLGARIWRLS